MFKNHLIELLAPRQDAPDIDAALEKFADRYGRGLRTGYVLSVPDNPMGTVRFRASEVLRELDLEIVPERLILHVNTFHTRQDLDDILATAHDLGVKYLLAVSGDGGERLPRLEPASLGLSSRTVTAVELLRYIHREHPRRFVCGVAFNPYEPQDHELARLRRKVDAGARFIITQPVIGYEPRLAPSESPGLPVVVGAWMSKRVELLSQCVGVPLPEVDDYDPVENLKALQQFYPGHALYLSLLDFVHRLPDLASWLHPPAYAPRFCPRRADTSAIPAAEQR